MKRIRALLRRLQDSKRLRQWMPYYHPSTLSYLLHYGRYSLQCRLGKKVSVNQAAKATAILVSYKRMHNMEPLVRTCLRCTWIESIVVLNNNPDEKIADWVRLKDKRITLIDEGINKGAMLRYVYASQSKGQYFLSVDDDIFLTSEQLSTLFEHLLKNPSVPHGMFGQRWLGAHATDPRQSFLNCVQGIDDDVDILNRVYFFTKAHAEECLRLAKLAGYNTDEELRTLSPVDDIFLAFSGTRRVRCHNVGRCIDCPSQAEPTIAQWMQKDFSEFRMMLYEKLSTLKPLNIETSRMENHA